MNKSLKTNKAAQKQAQPSIKKQAVPHMEYLSQHRAEQLGTNLSIFSKNIPKFPKNFVILLQMNFCHERMAQLWC